MPRNKHHHTVHNHKRPQDQKPSQEMKPLESAPEPQYVEHLEMESEHLAINETSVPEDSPILSVPPTTQNRLSEANTIEKLSENIENFLNTLAFGAKPWYLTSTEVYSIVKNTLVSIPKSEEVLDIALQGVAKATEYIHIKTNERTVIFDVDKCQELIQVVDKAITDLSMKLDDGLDSLRAQASVGLRKLIISLIEHKEVVVKVTVENAEWLNDTATANYALAALRVKSRFEQMMEMTKALIAFVKEKYPQPCEKVEFVTSSSFKIIEDVQSSITSYANDKKESFKMYSEKTVESIKNSTTQKTATLLRTAQPYVHATVVQSKPYVEKAIAITQPYTEQVLTKAQPYLDAVQIQSMHYIDAAKENPFVAKQVEVYTPCVVQCLETAQFVMGEVKAYALPVL